MYFDPGFGSLLIQAVVAAIAAAGLVFGTMKLRIKGLFGRKKAEETPEKSGDEEL